MDALKGPATVADIEWSGVDFVDFGCSGGGSLDYCAKRFGATRGVGIDLDEAKVAQAREAGFTAVVADAAKLELPHRVRFVSMMHFLEHLPALAAVRAALKSAAETATDFIFVRHPSFEQEEYLESLGLCQYWWRWRGHPAHIQVADFCELFEELGLSQYMIRYLDPVLDSSDSSVLPLGTPINQHEYESGLHGPKPDVRFRRPLWRQQEIFVALRPYDPYVWSVLTARWGRDRAARSSSPR